MSQTSEIKQAALAGDLTTLRDVQSLCGFSIDEAAHFCGVLPQSYRRWRKDRVPPMAVIKLLPIWSGSLPWPDWRDWEIHGDRLLAPAQPIYIDH